MAASIHPHVYGLMAEFEDPNQLVSAAHRAREAGYRRVDAYSPLPIEELHEAIGFHDTKLPLIVLDRRHGRRAVWLSAAVLGVDDGVSA